MPRPAKLSNKIRYSDHPAFAKHTAAEWIEIVNHAVLLREAHTGPRITIGAHIDAVIAGKRAPAPMCPVEEMEVKFFPRDVVGKQPRKPGDTFEARFFGAVRNFKLTCFGNGCFMATLA